MINETTATLVLEDGTVFRGRSFGAHGEQAAEIIFNTGMMGYQEVLTDPSYSGQMVVMTYPLIGNYGISELDAESPRAHVAGFIVREASRVASNWRSEERIQDYMKREGIVGIEGIDTRALVLHLRSCGSMSAVVSTKRHDAEVLRQVALDSPRMEGRNLVKDVTIAQSIEHTIAPSRGERGGDLGGLTGGEYRTAMAGLADGPKVVAYDFGMKRTIPDLMVAAGMKVTIVPSHTTAQEVLALKPDGVFLSNGPGDPAALSDVLGEVKSLVGRVPLFGICLGHQILGLACGGDTFKLKFGHHGANHPVKDLLTNRVEITSQNHGFCVDPTTLPSTSAVTHVNLNDGTLEGFEDETLKFTAVQFHPEASAGPHDSGYLFGRFRKFIEKA
ncbi:carbamoyl phosphate synthase small subunit [candidate division BRC1 bacterium HGW-BRC1-1]|jgi:carbamoyl-phosphate synthase small subunit|nr:MAG: carbamoyl phosphate synthase small subunit [candidate division BRC1 bacterium HGW-BRC1-1]